MQTTMLLRFRCFLSGAVAALLLAAAGGAQAQAYVNATVGGELAPGVYGRINIGNAPPPPLIYSEPVIIQRPAVVVPRSPIYMYVPPGHAKNWGKHCRRYNACNQPVYFVQEPPPRRGPPPRHPATTAVTTATGTTTTTATVASTTTAIAIAIMTAVTRAMARVTATATATEVTGTALVMAHRASG